MSKTRNVRYEQVIEHAELIYDYLKSNWQENYAPPILKAKFELQYDLSLDLGLTLEQNPNDMFEDAILYLVDHNEAIINLDIQNQIRIYAPDENIVREAAFRLLSLLELKWQTDKAPRLQTVWKELTAKDHISKHRFKQIIFKLQEFRLIELVHDSKNRLRVIKPFFSESNKYDLNLEPRD